jgi:hypothetical protein
MRSLDVCIAAHESFESFKCACFLQTCLIVFIARRFGHGRSRSFVDPVTPFGLKWVFHGVCWSGVGDEEAVKRVNKGQKKAEINERTEKKTWTTNSHPD